MAVASSGFSSPAWSAEPSAQTTPPSVTVPFNPPIGKALHLHYELHKTRTAGSVVTPIVTETGDDELVFTEHNSHGFVLRWTTKAASIQTNPDSQAITDQVVAASIGKSALIQTDDNGAPKALLNPGEMRTLLAGALDKATAAFDAQNAAKSQAERDAAHATLAKMADLYRSMSDDQIAQTVLEDSIMLFRHGGETLVPGHPTTFSTSLEAPFVNKTVAASETVSLRNANDTDLTIAVTRASDPKDMNAVAAALFEVMTAKVDAAQREQMKPVLESLRSMSVADETVLTLDAHSGLPRHVTHSRRVVMTDLTRDDTGDYTLGD